MQILEIIINYKEWLFDGLKITLLLFTISSINWIILWSLIWWICSKNKGLFYYFIKIINSIVSWIPVIILLYWMYYPAQELLNMQISSFNTALIVLSVINIFSISEVIEKSIKNIPKQFIEVSNICGISNKTRFLKIELPLIFRHAISPFIIIQINILHITLFTSLISVNEIFRTAQQINSIIYKPIEIYTTLAIFFLIISILLKNIANFFEKKYIRDFSEK